jgi:hypothetical protein
MGGAPMMGGGPPMMGGAPPMMGGPGMNPHMGAPMHGFGPGMHYSEPEIRHAPHNNRPEHQEMPEEAKVVKEAPIHAPGGETLPSGSDKFFLYGALEDLQSEELLKQTEHLKRRRRINCIPALNALFLPWVLFLTVFSLASFYVHYVFPVCVFVFNGSAVLFSLVYAYKSFNDVTQRPEKAFYPTYLSIMFLIAVSFGWLLGDLNFWFNMQPCYNIEHLASYNNVNPSTQTMPSGQTVPTRGKRYQDAGKVYFEHNAVLDIKRSMSFKMGDLYCVAPIVDPNCKKNCGYDFWAVGLNCCAEDVADFRCGEYKNPSAKNGLRLMHDEQRPNYRLAVLEAEGVHKIISNHPLFFYWLHDPNKEIAHMKHQGFKGFVLLMIVSFFGYGGAAYLSLKWARQKYRVL